MKEAKDPAGAPGTAPAFEKGPCVGSHVWPDTVRLPSFPTPMTRGTALLRADARPHSPESPFLILPTLGLSEVHARDKPWQVQGESVGRGEEEQEGGGETQ